MVHAAWKRSKMAALVTAVALGVAVTSAGAGCETGGKEGDRCNPLVLRDECSSGLRCRRLTCALAYCCPAGESAQSGDPNCQGGDGCPSEDEADASADADGSATDAEPLEAEADAPSSDGSDGSVQDANVVDVVDAD